MFAVLCARIQKVGHRGTVLPPEVRSRLLQDVIPNLDSPPVLSVGRLRVTQTPFPSIRESENQKLFRFKENGRLKGEN